MQGLTLLSTLYSTSWSMDGWSGGVARHDGYRLYGLRITMRPHVILGPNSNH